MEIKITKTTSPNAKPADESALGFGKIFTDHMFMMDYSAEQGWHDARIVPFAPIPIHPASTVLPNGDILTVYYQPMQPKGKPCLMATRWRVTK